MKLCSVRIENFRIFREPTTIQLSDLTALIGRNDIGKSSVLEALELFFEGDHVAIDADDPTKGSDSKECRISCEFCDLPSEVVIDVEARTSLRAEYLLNLNGNLQIEKVFDCSKSKITHQVFAKALHPLNEGVNNLLSLKIAELRSLLRKLRIDENGVNQASKPDLRRVIWANIRPLNLGETLVPLGAEDAKAIWSDLQNVLPQFALFQADRASKDNDAEVQDPMKVAVKSALSELDTQLEEIKEQVKAKATEVALRTVEKLKELDPTLASELSPNFSGVQKWETLFKLSLTSDGEIPINKRGSGVRRLILLSFFRAEAERRARETGTHGIIFAIEEPETCQHPHYQKFIVAALDDLVSEEGIQVLITTHNPAFAGLLPVESLRYLHKNGEGAVIVTQGTQDVPACIAQELGVLPDHRVRVIVGVEGPNDVKFLRHISRILHAHNPHIPDAGRDLRLRAA